MGATKRLGSTKKSFWKEAALVWVSASLAAPITLTSAMIPPSVWQRSSRAVRRPSTAEWRSMTSSWKWTMSRSSTFHIRRPSRPSKGPATSSVWWVDDLEMLRPFYVLFHLIHLSLLLLLRACDGADSPALLASSKSSCAKATKDSDSASRAARAISTSPATMAFTSQRSWTAGRPKLTGGSPSVINLFWSGTCRYVPSPHLEIEKKMNGFLNMLLLLF